MPQARWIRSACGQTESLVRIQVKDTIGRHACSAAVCIIMMLLPFYPRPLFLTWGVLHNHHGPYKDYMMLEAWVLAHTSTIAASFLFRSFRKVCSSRTQSADSPVQSERKTCMQRKAWFSEVVQLL